MKRTLSAASGVFLLASALVSAAPAFADGGEVNIYSFRQPYLIQPLLNAFTKETGIKNERRVFHEGSLASELPPKARTRPLTS